MGCVSAQPDAVTDCGSHAIPDSCAYAEVRRAPATLPSRPGLVLGTAGQGSCVWLSDGRAARRMRAGSLLRRAAQVRRGEGTWVRTGFVHAQPDAVTDGGSCAVADSCPYAVARSEPNTGAYPRPHAGPDR